MNLTELTTKVSALLDDSANAKYSVDIVQSAIGIALVEYNKLAPRINALTVTSVGAQKYTLSLPETTERILSVQYAPESMEYRLPFYAYRVDASWILSVSIDDAPIPAGKTFTILYQPPNTIDGYNNETVTTIRTRHENQFCMGAAGFAMQTRANSRIEPINLNNGVTEQLRAQSGEYLAIFRKISLNTDDVEKNRFTMKTVTITRTDPEFTESNNY